MEGDSGGTRLGLWYLIQRFRCSLDQPFAGVCWSVLVGDCSSQLSEEVR